MCAHKCVSAVAFGYKQRVSQRPESCQADKECHSIPSFSQLGSTKQLILPSVSTTRDA